VNEKEIWLTGLYDLRTFRCEFALRFRKQRAESKSLIGCHGMLLAQGL
jgi:hypothetical protein